MIKLLFIDFDLHSAVHAARPDLRCIIFIGYNPVVACSAMKMGILPLSHDSCKVGEIAIHSFCGSINEPEEKDKLIRSLGPNAKVLLLTNHGALCCGETIEEAFFHAYHIIHSCELQLQLMSTGLENLRTIPEETRKKIFMECHTPPNGLQDNKEKSHQVS